MDTDEYASIIYGLLEGDDLTDQAFRLLRRDGYVDEDYEWIYDD